MGKIQLTHQTQKETVIGHILWKEESDKTRKNSSEYFIM